MSDVHESRQGEFRAVTIAMTALAAVFVTLRFLSPKKGMGLGMDDFAMLASLVSIVTAIWPFYLTDCLQFLLFAVAGLNLALIQYGMGLDASTLSTKSLEMIAKLLIAYDCVYCTTIGMIKLSVLLMYTRIFPTRGFRVAVIVLGIITVAWIIVIACMSVIQCAPIERAWDTSIPGACIDASASFIANAVPNIVTDIAIILLPMRALWRMKTTITHRFVIFSSAYRFSALFASKATDKSWTLGNACTWGVIECSSGIISACMPTLYPFFGTILSRLSIGSQPKTTDLKILGRAESTKPAFRPQNEHVGKPMVQLVVTQPEEDLGDEMPLNTIMVRRSMTWQESNCGRDCKSPRHWK
ncbi:uncharacterized protein N7484_008841 [Penicillium longicatenatum]|uniref:uncharacterized protein n=1 Tax=Penicillium longicatenatum TaxID=1561947 RepID=UPI002548CA00|nr:uncharacterized protein N7484_008841 [Penicillium longicatenatum]KAJ5635528.1 hypothetical protein N7484_008841 [Penicillium longicatenatum]